MHICFNRVVFHYVRRPREFLKYNLHFAQSAQTAELCSTMFAIKTVDQFSFIPTGNRRFSTSSGLGSLTPGGDESDSKHVYLMDIPEIIWPNPVMHATNWFKSNLISAYYDPVFSTKDFIKGAEQAVETISNMISENQFESLHGLVDSKVIPEIQHNYSNLSREQRRFIRVHPEDIYFRFIYEIGMIFDDDQAKRLVEIMAVFQGIHKSEELQKSSMSDIRATLEEDPHRMFVCNYRFLREYTKDVEDDWTVNALNHFSATELIKRFPYGK